MVEALGTEKKACVQSMAIVETRGEKICNCLIMGYSVTAQMDRNVCTSTNSPIPFASAYIHTHDLIAFRPVASLVAEARYRFYSIAVLVCTGLILIK